MVATATLPAIKAMRATDIERHWRIFDNAPVSSRIGSLRFPPIMNNIFDEEVLEPSTNARLISDDLPQAGRSIFGEVRYHFNYVCGLLRRFTPRYESG